MSKCLVTGGAGFIGSNLTDELIRLGHTVAIIDNLYSGKREYINARAEFHELDICSPAVAAVFASFKPDFVFHLAAQIEVPRSVADPVFDNKVNALGSLNIFKNACEAGVKKVIFMSTGGALYGDCLKPAIEDDLVKPTSPYAIHKFSAERYLDMFNIEQGMKYAVLRPANVYGPRQFKGGECGVIGIFTSNAIRNLPSIFYGDGSKTRDYVFVADLVDAAVVALSPEAAGVFNIGTGVETSNLGIIAAIEKITGKKFEFTFAPDKPGEVKRSVLSHARAKRVLGWEPRVGLADGIRKTMDWLKTRNS